MSWPGPEAPLTGTGGLLTAEILRTGRVQGKDRFLMLVL